MADTTDNYGLPYPEGGVDFVKDGAQAIQDLAEAVDENFTGWATGPASSRPTSTSGSPGIAGRIWRSTDTGLVSIDTGTSWIEIATIVKTQTVTWNPDSAPGGEFVSQTFTVTGAQVGDAVLLTPEAGGDGSGIGDDIGVIYTGKVVSANTVMLLASYPASLSDVNPPSATFTIRLVR